MKVTLWGTRGSLPSARAETVLYGGNTSCVQIESIAGNSIILDAGSGIHPLGQFLDKKVERVDILLSHLHLDHIQGLGFFAPIWDKNVEIHIYAPATFSESLDTLLTRYLSPPLFPVFLSDVPGQLFLHKIGDDDFDIGNIKIKSRFICHPGTTLGYRISTPKASVAYLSDHEPILGAQEFIKSTDWISGYSLANEADLLIHDSQYTSEEYQEHIGWGHSSIKDALQFAKLAKVKAFVSFHHDPSHNDEALDQILAQAVLEVKPNFKVIAGKEGSTFQLS